MRRARWVGTGAVVALVVAVLLVRPGSQAQPAEVAAPSPATVADPLLRPAALAGRRLADVPVTDEGVGPLRLGQDVEDLLAAGWQTYDTGGCRRLLDGQLQDATLSGWVVDGQVASVQVESTAVDVEPVRSDVGSPSGYRSRR